MNPVCRLSYKWCLSDQKVFLQNMFKIKYPNHTHEELLNSTKAYILQVQSGLTRKPAYDKAHYRQAR